MHAYTYILTSYILTSVLTYILTPYLTGYPTAVEGGDVMQPHMALAGTNSQKAACYSICYMR